LFKSFLSLIDFEDSSRNSFVKGANLGHVFLVADHKTQCREQTANTDFVKIGARGNLEFLKACISTYSKDIFNPVYWQ
jgi:hypothetical protein